MPIAEKFVVKGLVVRDLLDKEFVKKIEEKGLNIFPVSLMFIKTKKEDEKIIPFPVVKGHQNDEDIKAKTLHVESPDTVLLGSVVKILEEMGGK